MFTAVAINLRILEELTNCVVKSSIKHLLRYYKIFRIITLSKSSELYEGDNAGEMSPGSNTESYPAFAHIGLRENPGKNLNRITCSDRDSNPGHLVSRPHALTVTPQDFTLFKHEKQRSDSELVIVLKQDAPLVSIEFTKDPFRIQLSKSQVKILITRLRIRDTLTTNVGTT
ncbi:hypothetical protein ANN_06158 [Periplaneta americana]|uniref:Uncharacterized protein n=1 Tax=Periplaneta americana TaxID=6978 RepID=A0ABQ8TE20_PERAM|nr:hypothetical protein ANN_06158 [Periplaneta americana]